LSLERICEPGKRNGLTRGCSRLSEQISEYLFGRAAYLYLKRNVEIGGDTAERWVTAPLDHTLEISSQSIDRE
jgi:hypothetical protein